MVTTNFGFRVYGGEGLGVQSGLRGLGLRFRWLRVQGEGLGFTFWVAGPSEAKSKLRTDGP